MSSKKTRAPRRATTRSQRSNEWAWLDALVGRLDEDCVQALTENPANQERPAPISEA